MVLFVLAIWLTAIYEVMNLKLFEEERASMYVHFIGLPVLLWTLIDELKKLRKISKSRTSIINQIKESLSAFVGLVLLYIFIVVPVLSGAIIMTDDILPKRGYVIIQGEIIDILEIEYPKGGNFEIVIKTESELLTFDTNGKEIKSYFLGANFNKEMKKGFWGLYSLKK